MEEQFGGEIQRIQWNNNIKSLWLSLYFILGIFFYVTIILATVFAVIIAIGYAIDPENFFQDFTNYELKPSNIYRIVKPYAKVFIFVSLAIMWFLKESLSDVGHFFSAQKLELPHTDPFYKTLENMCIERGLTVPQIFIWSDTIFSDNDIAGAVVQDIQKRTSIVVSPATFRLPPDEMEAFIAQMVYRIYSKDVMFMSLLCFFGFFPDHLRHNMPKPVAKIFSPYLKLTNIVLSPIRNTILNMRLGRSEIGAITLTRKKAPMAALLEKLTPLETVRIYFYDQYLPLFITKTDEEYRKALIRRA